MLLNMEADACGLFERWKLQVVEVGEMKEGED